MIVYCSSLWLENTTQLENLFSIITLWLYKKTNCSIRLGAFTDQLSRTFSNGAFLNVTKSDEEFPYLYSFRYTEQDKEVSGRRWITEIGIRQDMHNSDIQCSFLVQTSEISINVPQPKVTTRPRLIAEIMKRCKPSRQTAGTDIKLLENLDDVEALAYELEFEGRRYPIILISPTTEGEYLVDLERLFYQTCGLAQIVKIPIGMDTFKITEILGKSRSSYNGAINIVFPMYQKGMNKIIPTYLLLENDIEDWKDSGFPPESEILRIISHRMNLPNSRIHITSEMVKDALRKHELDKLRQRHINGENSQQYLELLEEQMQGDALKYKEQIQNLQTENDYYIGEYEDADEKLKSCQNKNEGLLSRIDSLKNAQLQRGVLNDCTEELRTLLESYFNEGLSPAESLKLIEKLYPERVVILDSAYKSADGSAKFFERKVVFNLLRKLVTNYWQALIDGKGDAEARLVFGKDEFSSSESETGENNKNTRRRRTFSYKGGEYEMMKHLKFGIKDSKVETIRIHFEWLSDEKKLIIGYCGAHLDFG